MIYTIKINKKETYSDIQTITGYIAKNFDDFDKVAVTDDENSAVEAYYTGAISDLVTSLYEFKPLFSDEQIKIENPDNFQEGVLSTVEKEIRDYLINSISSKWFTKIDPSLSKHYEGKCITNFIGIKALLYQRKKPEIR